MKTKVRDLRETTALVTFGPESEPEKFEIDLLKYAVSLLSIDDLGEVEVEAGDRLGETPYSQTDRAPMPLAYLCEGSVWLNFCSPDDRYANISLVPHLDQTMHGALSPHHNLWLYWTDFDGSQGSSKHISGHHIPADEPVSISISWGREIRKGTIG